MKVGNFWKPSKNSIALLFLLIACVGCKKEEVVAPDLGYAYFPNDIGNFVVYQVDSVNYDLQQDSVRFYIKEELTEIYTDAENQRAERITRYRKASQEAEWQISDIWSQKRTPSSAFKVEENERFIKMVFPVNLTAVWNGNALNTREAWEYTYLTEEEPIRINGLDFAESTTIQQRFRVNAVDREQAFEIYAKGVGLIQKTFVDLNIQDGALTGYTWRQSVVEFGKN